MNKPLVSIIIVNWNGGEILKESILSLSAIDYPNWELIIVDNGSTDGSTEEIAPMLTDFKLIKNTENLGFALANNQGYQKAEGKYILLLNNDTKVSADSLSKLVSRMESDSTVGVVQPKIYMMDKAGYLDNAGSFLTRIGFLEHWGFGQKDGSEFKKERTIFSAKGACMLIRREVVEKVGLFDKDFVSYFEESDFCWRVWLAGWKVLFFPEAAIFHKVGFTIKRLDVANLNFHYYKNRICSLIKNLGTYNLVIILTSHLFVSFSISAAFLLRGKPSSSLMILRSIGWNLANLGNTLEKRKIVQGTRKLTDRELFEGLMVPVDWKRFWGDFRRVEKDIEN